MTALISKLKFNPLYLHLQGPNYGLDGLNITMHTEVKVGVLRPVQQPGSYWDRSSELPLVGLEPTEVTCIQKW